MSLKTLKSSFRDLGYPNLHNHRSCPEPVAFGYLYHNSKMIRFTDYSGCVLERSSFWISKRELKREGVMKVSKQGGSQATGLLRSKCRGCLKDFWAWESR